MEYELYHHGILGMKWGIRRYQNKDGSLTPEGRRRLSREDVDKTFKDVGRIGQAGSEVSSVSSKGKAIAKGIFNLKRDKREYNLSKMSDDDLRKAINRMNLEENYKYLKNSDISKGESRVNSWLDIAGGVTGIASSAAVIGYLIWKLTAGKDS